MKCFAFVDLHGQKKAYDDIKKKIRKAKPDFLLCAGDITIFEIGIKSLMRRLAKLDGKLFLVHGNHEEENIVRKIAKEYKNIEFIHRRIVKYKDLILLGWGGGGFTIRDHEFEKWVKTIKKDLKKYKKEGRKIIFVGHAPFYKTELDHLGNVHNGNKSFTNFIKEFKVDIGVCGHFHENKGKEDTIRKCRVYNPGSRGKVIEV
ncbi:MAG: metallophosphoesterase [Nanoarchaeota archaeon]|nr:metallophosphoesterase [Nanoarchaeota archaeon]